MSEKKKVFLLLAFSLMIAVLPHQLYLPSNITGAASQNTHYINYSISLSIIGGKAVPPPPPPPPPSPPPSGSPPSCPTPSGPPTQAIPPSPSGPKSQVNAPGVTALIQAFANQITTNPVLDLGILMIIFLISIASYLAKSKDPRRKYRKAKKQVYYW